MIFAIISSLLLLVSLVFLILGDVSSPVTTALKLASHGDFTYGIFGYCNGSSCSKSLYPVAFGDVDKGARWLFANSTRDTLAKTFIVAPIATGLVGIALIFTLILICYDTTPVVILALIFGVIGFVATALIAVMVVLVFHPFVAWTGWLQVAAAGVALIAVPCLILSIRVHPKKGDDDTSENASLTSFAAYDKFDTENKTGFSGPPIGGVRPPPSFPNTLHDDESSTIKDNGFKESQRSGTNFTDGSQSSLYDLRPRFANDMTMPHNELNKMTTANDSFVNINNGPSTPVSAKQKMAPSFVPNVAVPFQAGKDASNPPYPPSERRSSAIDSQKYGVFDHHPSVEGHQPFTELDDENVSPENAQNVSDDDSDFTSISQRTPNAGFAATLAPPSSFQPRPQPQQYPQQHSHHQQAPNQFQQQQQQYQQYQSYYPQQYQQNYTRLQQPHQPQQPQEYGRAPAGYGAYNQSPQFGHGYPPHRPNKTTISDNILNNNPEFSIGTGAKRKQYGNAFPPTKFGVAPGPRQGQRSQFGARNGPYGPMN